MKAYAATSRQHRETTLHSLIEEMLPHSAERLACIREIGAFRGASGVISHLMENRAWLAFYSMDQRPRIVANLGQALVSAREYESGVSSSLAGCAQWLDTALRSGKAAEEPSWMNDEADAVRITTVHASKGLEFPVVAVMRMERGAGRPRSSSVEPSKKMGIAISDIPPMLQQAEENSSLPLSLPWERALEARENMEESARLFYVACTRAKEALFLCGVVSEDAGGLRSVKKDSWLDWTLSWLAAENKCDWQDLEGPPLVFAGTEVNNEDAASSPPLSPAAESPSRSSPCKPHPLPPKDGLTLSSLSATSFALFEWCPFAWRRRYRMGLDLRWEIPDDEGPSSGGAELGSLVHWILAQWDLKVETLEYWLSETAALYSMPPALRDTWKNERSKATLRSWLISFVQSSEGGRIAKAMERGTLLRESSFCARPRGVRLVGAMDAAWPDEKESGIWHVRDYKISLSENAPSELYRAQLAFYALAVKLLAEKTDNTFRGVDVGLIFIRSESLLGDTRFFPLEYDWNSMEKQLSEAAMTASQGAWIPKHEHCRPCPWRRGCPKTR